MKKNQLLFISGLIIIQACGDDNSANQPQRFGQGQHQQATSIETITVGRETISKQIRSFGNIKAQDIVNVTPQVNNRITNVYSHLGDTVQQGQALAKIYDTPFKDQVDQARAQLRQSEAAFQRDSMQFKRQQELHQKELISSTEFDNAQATYQNSKAQLESSQANLTQSMEDLNNTTIKSPVYGVILTRNIAEGDLASSGQVAFEIANLTGYECRVYLPMEEWRETKIGQMVNLRVSNQEEVNARGRISRISPRLDPTTGLGEVVISLTEKGSSIYQGVLVESIINVDTHQNAAVIPRSALVENVQTLIEPESNTIQLSRSYSAFVVHDDTLAVKKDLKLGIEQGDKVEILTGLQPGDKIVITGQNSLEDSSRVQIAGSSPFQQKRNIPIENSEAGNRQNENNKRSNSRKSGDSSSTQSNQ